MVRAAIWIALAGCGRYHFANLPDGATDATRDTVDALTGHDEDGDGIPDSIDPCPHLAGDATDTDGDGVGDACDPEPTLPNEHWILFATMQPGDQPFDDASAFEQKADSLHIIGDVQPVITRTFGTVRVDIGFTVNALTAAAQHQVAAGLDNSMASEYYFGELNENTTASDVAVVQYDTTNGYVQFDPQMPPAFHTGVGYFRLDAVTGGAPRYDLVAGWTGEVYQSMAATAAYTGGQDLRFAFNGMDIDSRYLALIATN